MTSEIHYRNSPQNGLCPLNNSPAQLGTTRYTHLSAVRTNCTSKFSTTFSHSLILFNDQHILRAAHTLRYTYRCRRHICISFFCVVDGFFFFLFFLNPTVTFADPSLSHSLDFKWRINANTLPFHLNERLNTCKMNCLHTWDKGVKCGFLYVRTSSRYNDFTMFAEFLSFFFSASNKIKIEKKMKNETRYVLAAYRRTLYTYSVHRTPSTKEKRKSRFITDHHFVVVCAGAFNLNFAQRHAHTGTHAEWQGVRWTRIQINATTTPWAFSYFVLHNKRICEHIRQYSVFIV